MLLSLSTPSPLSNPFSHSLYLPPFLCLTLSLSLSFFHSVYPSLFFPSFSLSLSFSKCMTFDMCFVCLLFSQFFFLTFMLNLEPYPSFCNTNLVLVKEMVRIWLVLPFSTSQNSLSLSLILKVYDF